MEVFERNFSQHSQPIYLTDTRTLYSVQLKKFRLQVRSERLSVELQKEFVLHIQVGDIQYVQLENGLCKGGWIVELTASVNMFESLFD